MTKMPKATSTDQEFKTPAAKRQQVQANREARAAAGKPGPREVDEALSHALKQLLVRYKKGELRDLMTLLAAHEMITRLARDHLMAKRGSNYDETRAAILERLSKPRRYPGMKA